MTRHVHHEPAHRWFAGSTGPWATCPLTQNAVLRILGQPRYPNSPDPPVVVAPLVAALIRHPRHCFWLDRRLNSGAVLGGCNALQLIDS